MEWYHIYLWTRLDAIQMVFGITAIIIGVAVTIVAIIFGIQKMDGDEDAAKVAKRGLGKLVLWFIIVTFPALLIPTSKDFAMMYVIPRIAKSEPIKKDLPELYDMAIGELKNMIKNKSKELKGGE